MEIAETILQQMGGPMAMRMIGGYALIADSNALSFRFRAHAKDSLNFCKVTLTPWDVYEFELGRVRAGKYTQVHKFDEIYCDQLIAMFEEYTGLYLRL